MSDFIFRIQPNIVLGSYTVSRLGEFAGGIGTKFMLVMDPILRQVGLADKITQSLSDRKVNFFVFEDISGISDTQTLMKALNLARQAHIDGVLAVGGSKMMNLGRAAASLYNEEKDVYALLDASADTAAEPLPLICVPSTIRDAFVFSGRIPLVDSRSDVVRLLKAQPLLCRQVLFDPNLMLPLSEKQNAAMQLETLCIAVESYLSQKASFFSDMIAEKSVELLGYAADGAPSLEITTPQEVLLSEGGCMASLASATSSLGAASLIALCINSRYKISRSLTTAILFPYILEDAAKFRQDRLAKLSRILRASPADSDVAKAASDLTDYVRQKLAKANLPTRLKDLGVNIEQLSLVAEDGSKLELINSLPRSMTSDDLFDLIKLAY
ncbi:MAG TPA: iron-containing alcohol dehydrogenase [Treponema sp.]|nr:iron-containing alcohol dehydrogenase [Treponema sp.]